MSTPTGWYASTGLTMEAAIGHTILSGTMAGAGDARAGVWVGVGTTGVGVLHGVLAGMPVGLARDGVGTHGIVLDGAGTLAGVPVGAVPDGVGTIGAGEAVIITASTMAIMPVHSTIITTGM